MSDDPLRRAAESVAGALGGLDGPEHHGAVVDALTDALETAVRAAVDRATPPDAEEAPPKPAPPRGKR